MHSATPKQIDLLLDRNEIEGLAIFSTLGQLELNHLQVPDSAVEKVALAITKMTDELREEDRQLKGLLMKSSTLSFLFTMVNDLVVVTKIEEYSSIKKIDNCVRSIIAETTLTQLITGSPQSTNKEDIQSTSVKNDTEIDLQMHNKQYNKKAL